MEHKEVTLQSSPKALEYLLPCGSTLLPVNDHVLLLSLPSVPKQYSDLGRVNWRPQGQHFKEWGRGRHLNYSWLPVTRTTANSNLALTRTKIDFPGLVRYIHYNCTQASWLKCRTVLFFDLLFHLLAKYRSVFKFVFVMTLTKHIVWRLIKHVRKTLFPRQCLVISVTSNITQKF